MNMIVQAIADAWLFRGLKYRVSEYLYGRDWYLPLSAALAKHKLSLNGKETLHDVVDTFRGFYWASDPLWGILDTVAPPIRLLDQGQDDCDAWAMLHSQAVDHALGPLGWSGRIVSYLADPWVLSHHFCAAVDPQGHIWAVQPRPTRGQPADQDPIIPEAFPSYDLAALGVASTYGARVVKFDVRDSMFRHVEV